MKKIIWGVIIGIWSLSLAGYHASAATMDFSVVANIPENQINKKLTYFDLLMQANQKQEISLTLTNTSDQQIEVMVEPNVATTNSNGVIDYTQNKQKKDSSMIYDFTEIISEKQIVKLEPQERKDVTFTIEMPEQEFDGIILGGFHIYQVEREDHIQTSQIENKYAYIIGVKLSETDKEVKPNLVLNDIQATLVNYRTAITINLQNTEMINMSGLTVETKITKEGHEEVLYQQTKEGMSLAPNSNFYLPISLNNKPIEPGHYHLYLSATDGDQTWELDKTFEIEGDQAKDLNKEAIELDKDYTWLYMLLSGIIPTSLVLLFIRKKEQKEKKQEQNEDTNSTLDEKRG